MLVINTDTKLCGYGVAALMANDICDIKISNTHNHYDPATRSVNILLNVWSSYTHMAAAIACHEVAHAWQHNRWPILFALKQLIIFDYALTLFLEWHASRVALRWIKQNLECTTEQLNHIKGMYADALKSYLPKWLTTIDY